MSAVVRKIKGGRGENFFDVLFLPDASSDGINVLPIILAGAVTSSCLLLLVLSLVSVFKRFCLVVVRRSADETS